MDVLSFEHDSWFDLHLESLRVILFVGKKSSWKASHLLARTFVFHPNAKPCFAFSILTLPWPYGPI